MKVKLISITPKAEELISYCARVSNPSNQENHGTAPRLIKYMIKHEHWSPFEMAHMVLEIETSRAISAQILRHRSFSFQEFSQRYSEVKNININSDDIKKEILDSNFGFYEFEEIEHRVQCESNRQSSEKIFNCEKIEYNKDIDCMFWHSIPSEGEEVERLFDLNLVAGKMHYLFNMALDLGISRETARMILPLCTKTRLYMAGNIRSWIHYIQLRTKPDTQKEHRLIAEECKKIFINELPIISEALGWINQP